MVWVPPPYKRNSLTGPLMGIIAQGIMQRIGQGHQAEESQKRRDWAGEEKQKFRDYKTEQIGSTRAYNEEQTEKAQERRVWEFLAGKIGSTPEQARAMLLGREGFKSVPSRTGLDYERAAEMLGQFGGQPAGGQPRMGPPSAVPQSMAPQAGPPGQMQQPEYIPPGAEGIPLAQIMSPEAPGRRPVGMPGLPGFEPVDLSSESDEDVEDFEAMDLLGGAHKAGEAEQAEGRPRMDIMEGLGGQQQEPRTKGEMFERMWPGGTPEGEMSRALALSPQQQQQQEKWTAKQKEARDPVMRGQRDQQQIDRVALIRERLKATMTASGANKKAAAHILGQLDKGKYNRSMEAQILGIRAGEPPDIGAVVDEIYRKGMEDYLQGGRGGAPRKGGPSRGGTQEPTPQEIQAARDEILREGGDPNEAGEYARWKIGKGKR